MHKQVGAVTKMIDANLNLPIHAYIEIAIEIEAIELAIEIVAHQIRKCGEAG